MPEMILPKIKQSHPYQLAELVVTFHVCNTIIAAAKSHYPKDPILETQACKQYEKFRIEDLKRDTFLENKKGLDAKFVKNYQSLNSDYSLGYYKTGLHY